MSEFDLENCSPLPFYPLEEEVELDIDNLDFCTFMDITEEELALPEEPEVKRVKQSEEINVESLEADPRFIKLFADNNFVDLRKTFEQMTSTQKEPETERERLLAIVLDLCRGTLGAVNWVVVRKLRRKFVDAHKAEKERLALMAPPEIKSGRGMWNRYTEEEDALILSAFECHQDSLRHLKWKSAKADKRFHCLFETHTLQSLKKHFADIKN